ncbi:E3 ubiquitin-protein ligase rnf168 [Formica fusca]
MYLKRTSKLLDLSSRATADVHLRDLMCPVCRGILIEPVTLPCTHNLCLRCLKGTFEHNSLSCPLCRVRVGSWLRNATKSETLVNHGLWELIRAKFPKEVENKHNGEEGDLSLDADYATKRILSAAGEIHREYEAQLQMAEEEMRRQRQAEQIASEALIQKIRVEEQQLLLAQLAQDQLLAKTLAKQQVVKKHKEATKCYNQCLNTSVSNYVLDASRFNTKTMLVNNVEMPQTEAAHLESRQMNLPESVSDSTKPRQTNTTLLSKIETICSNIYGSNEANASSMHKVSLKYCCQKQIPVYNAVTKTLKHKTISKFTQPCTSNYSTDPGCSTSKAYMTETKEELRVPSDVVNSKKKSLGIEVCMTLADDDERIGSAESSGSHDSINQEIHHFKPIKTVPRTKLKVSSDGKQIDPKLIRVIPVLKKASNAVPKPPSPTHMKRIIGCSWSAFRGRIKQDAKQKQAAHNLEETLIDQQPSTSLDHSQTVSNKSMTKPHTNDVIRRLDFVPEPSFDSNKNYTKNANKIVNGLKTSKKLDDESDAKKTRKSWRTRVRNGMIVKSKGNRNLRSNKRAAGLTLNVIDEEEDDPMDSFGKVSPQNDEQDSDCDDVAVENIAERIKRRKENMEKETSKREIESNTSKKSRAAMKKKTLSERRDESPATDHVPFSTVEESAEVNIEHSGPRRTKRRKISRTSQSNTEALERIEFSSDTNGKVNLRKSTRNLTKVSKSSDHVSDGARNKNNNRFNYDSPPESSDETEECVPESNHVVGTCVKELPSDKEAIEEQQQIERLLLQEKEDFELARRLQAQFDEMERIAGRPRRTRKTTESERNIETDATGTVFKTNVKRKPIVDRAVSTVVKRKRGRPPKRVKIATDAREDETRAR